MDEEGNASGWLGHALLDNCLAYMNDVCSNLDTLKDMAQLYLADADEEDEDGGCLELRKLWMGGLLS